MLSLSSLGALWFRGGLVRKVVTAYSGDSFPTYSPNPIFARAYRSGEVEVEHWSFLSLLQRLDAAARGLPAAVTSSLRGSSMAGNEAFHEVETAAGTVGMVDPLAPDVALLHAPLADRDGNVALSPPLLEGVAGAWAARRGVVVTVERVVDDLRPWSAQVRIPAHRVLAAVEAPFGAHPGGLSPGTLPVDGYGEDIDFWVEARDASRGDFDAWARTWCLDVGTQADYLAALGDERLARLRARANAASWQDDDAAWPLDTERGVTSWERAAVWTGRELSRRILALPADALLAGAGVANLAAWVGAADARAQGSTVRLAAELGLWGYEPTPADPFIFNHRSFPSAEMLTDVGTVLGMVMPGPGTRSIACVGAGQVDRAGNLNTTDIPGGPFLVGSGGANDAVSTADETVVVTLLEPGRTPERAGYVTSPGTRVRTVVTDRGVLRKRDGELWLAAAPAPVEDGARAAVEACGWDLRVERDLTELAAPEEREVLALRNYDRRGRFLGTAS